MNIFYLDQDPTLAAIYQCDAHVVKMMTESAQMLSTVCHELNVPAPMKATHSNHLCTRWVRASGSNFNWLTHHALALCNEWRHRYEHERDYKHEQFLHDLLVNSTASEFPDQELTPPALAMPLDCVMYHPDDLRQQRVMSYRRYYHTKKRSMPRFRYTNREMPSWLK